MPETIGRFRIESVLGQGGMGAVYKAVDPTLKRTVAIKTVRPDIDRPEYLERMYREAQACARLNHPNIVTVFEAGEIDGVVYIAMEYLRGKNLAEVLAEGRMTFEEKLRTLMSVLDALHHAHGLDVIHRDVKPSNVHIQEDGTVKLVDFGLARMVQANTLTISGTIVGTPHYASPEQLRGEPIDRRTDVYSTGAVAYEMLAGRLPFRGGDDDSISTVILRVVSQPPPAMESSISKALPELEAIVLRSMAKSRDERFQTAQEFRNALNGVLSSSTDAIRKVDSQIDRTVVLPTSDRASTVTVAPARLSAASAPTVSGSQASAPVASGSNRTMVIGGLAAAAVLVAALVITKPWASADPVVNPVQPSNAPTPTGPAPVASQPASNTAAAPTTVPPSSPAAPQRNAAAPDTVAPGAGLALTNAGGPAPAATSPATPAMVEADAKELFSGENTGLKYRLQQRVKDFTGNDVGRDVDLSTPFKTGDDVRFVFESNIDGYLYVLQKGTSGNWTVLYPDPNITGGRNTVKKNRELLIPDDDWFALKGDPGVEEIFVLLSKDPLTSLPGFSKTTVPETVSSSTLVTMQSAVRSRDLVLKKDKGGTAQKPVNANYVVDPTAVSKVSANIALTHGQ
jgi:serine/threonine-protein kinase